MMWRGLRLAMQCGPMYPWNECATYLALRHANSSRGNVPRNVIFSMDEAICTYENWIEDSPPIEYLAED